MLTPSERSLRARIGAYALHARHDPRETTRAARDRFLARFEEAVRADFPDLTETEVARRAEALKKAHMAGLAYRSARARSSRKGRPNPSE